MDYQQDNSCLTGLLTLIVLATVLLWAALAYMPTIGGER